MPSFALLYVASWLTLVGGLLLSLIIVMTLFSRDTAFFPVPTFFGYVLLMPMGLLTLFLAGHLRALALAARCEQRKIFAVLASVGLVGVPFIFAGFNGRAPWLAIVIAVAWLGALEIPMLRASGPWRWAYFGASAGGYLLGGLVAFGLGGVNSILGLLVGGALGYATLAGCQFLVLRGIATAAPLVANRRAAEVFD